MKRLGRVLYWLGRALVWTHELTAKLMRRPGMALMIKFGEPKEVLEYLHDYLKRQGVRMWVPREEQALGPKIDPAYLQKPADA